MFAAKRLTTTLPRVHAQRALFHNTRPAFVKVGDALPDLDVQVEGSPGNKVNLAKELKGKGVIVGTPAAFSMYLDYNTPRKNGVRTGSIGNVLFPGKVHMRENCSEYGC